MTATPIPRTLGQVLYADLDVSTLRTPPAGRRPDPDGHPPAGRPRRHVAAGPRRGRGGASHVRGRAPHRRRDAGRRRQRDGAADPFEGDDELPDEDVETAWAAAAEVEYERLTALLAPLRVGIVHGRLKPVDRDAEMARFRDGELDVLVGTTVVEVGVDVAEATMMVVEGADRFGLAQLHQLRGRVGRGTVASFCVLVSTAAEGTTELERLKAVASTTDGFALAERDFELRREGDVLGLAQSGLPRLRVATLANPDHRELAARARTYAEALVGEDGRARRRRAGAGPRARAPAGCATCSPATRPARPDGSATDPADGRRRPRDRGHGEGRPPRGARAGHAAARRPGQADAVRDPRAGPRRRAWSRDLFAGSGAGGIEALSRGAARAVFVERTPAPRGSSRRTCGGPASTAAGGSSRGTSIAWLGDAAGAAAAGPFDLVLVDPPYEDTAALAPALELVGAARSRRRRPASWPSTSGATPRRRRSGC